MEKYSFETFGNEQTRDNATEHQNPPRERVIKKEQIRQNGRKVINHGHGGGQDAMSCKPILTDGRITAIEVECRCGNTTRIQLEYDE